MMLLCTNTCIYVLYLLFWPTERQINTLNFIALKKILSYEPMNLPLFNIFHSSLLSLPCPFNAKKDYWESKHFNFRQII
jgi:hypothetical protein